MTTNYDDLVEAAIAANPDIVAVYDSDVILSGDAKVVLKIHGDSHLDAKEIVLETGKNAVTLQQLISDAEAKGRQVAPPTGSSEPVAVGRIVERALAQLPLAQRERYAEEWAADVRDISGRCALLRWRIGIWFVARRLGKPATSDAPSRANG